MTDRRSVEAWLAGYLRAWVLRLEPDGRCREYVEWWIDRTAPDSGEPTGA